MAGFRAVNSMIDGLVHMIQDDISIFLNWIKQNDSSANHGNQDLMQRIQSAAIRLLAFVGMAFASLWAVSLITFMVTLCLITLFKLALAVALYVYAHDVFVMSQ